jgi:hypothetical protein
MSTVHCFCDHVAKSNDPEAIARLGQIRDRYITVARAMEEATGFGPTAPFVPLMREIATQTGEPLPFVEDVFWRALDWGTLSLGIPFDVTRHSAIRVPDIRPRDISFLFSTL